MNMSHGAGDGREEWRVKSEESKGAKHHPTKDIENFFDMWLR